LILPIKKQLNLKNELIIAEKPSFAREIAKVFGATTKKDGYVYPAWCYPLTAFLAFAITL